MVPGTTSSRRSSNLLIGAVAISAIVFCIHMVEITSTASLDDKTTFTDLLIPIANLATTAALFYAARSTARHSRQLSRAWSVIAFAQLSYTVGDIIYSVLELGLHQAPFPSIADVFYLAYYPLLFIGIRMLTRKENSWHESLKTFLDTSIIMLASLLGFVNFLLGPILLSGVENSLLKQILGLAYPVSDLVIIWALMMLLFNQHAGQHPGPIWMLIFSMTIMIAADSAFGYQSLAEAYRGGLVDLGWTATYGLALIGAAWQGVIASRTGPEAQNYPANRFTRYAQRSIQYIPYFWAMAAFGLLVVSHSRQQVIAFPVLAGAVGIIIGLVLIRQIIALSENQSLSSRLRGALDQVQEQATTLENTNRELQVEIIERMRAEQQLSFDALHDDLTSLANRTLFLDRLGWAMEYARRRSDCPFSVLFMDLDSFKVVNDSLGHNTGDELIKAIAERLKSCLRSSDTVARLGGDEFVILLEDTRGAYSATAAAQRILDDLANPFVIQGHRIVTSASIGLVTDISGYNQAEDVLRDADIAMYHAKAMGKSRFEIFDTRLRAQIISRLEMENDLRHSLSLGNEFVLYYQPILSLEPYRITGFEALIRWNHPRRGLILPNDFIPLAEETGLILPLGRWVLLEACRQVRAWQEVYPMEPPLTVSVNISSKQFNQPDFVAQIEEALRETGIEGRSLKLELTESLCLEISDTALGIFERLNALGVHSQIDDFGTGYSALGYLQHFPIHTLKIDRTFIQEIGGQGSNPDLVRTIVALARDLGMDAIAEGIETEEQLEELRELGCPFGQGFLFAHPLESQDALNMLVRQIIASPFPGQEVPAVARLD